MVEIFFNFGNILFKRNLKISASFEYNFPKLHFFPEFTVYCEILYADVLINCIVYSFFAAAPECDAGQFSCESYKFNHTNCIPSHYRCDKEKDCHDNSDEQTCSKYLF